MAEQMRDGLDLEPIRARAEAATTGPWTTSWARYSGAPVHEARVILDDGDLIGESILAMHCKGRTETAVIDAEFIAAARTDVPALVAEVDRLRGAASDIERLSDTYTVGGTEIVIRRIIDLRRERDEARTAVAERDAEIERLRADLAVVSGHRDDYLAAAKNAMSSANADRAVLGAVAALAEVQTWIHDEHDSHDIVYRDDLRAALAPVSGAGEGAPTSSEPFEDPWCREEGCQWRHWRSGDMPTHRRGEECPADPVAEHEQEVRAEEAAELMREDVARWVEGATTGIDRRPAFPDATRTAASIRCGGYESDTLKAILAARTPGVTPGVRCDSCSRGLHGGCQGHRVACSCGCGDASDGGRLG